jgi:hypothetical protein
MPGAADPTTFGSMTHLKACCLAQYWEQQIQRFSGQAHT